MGRTQLKIKTIAAITMVAFVTFGPTCALANETYTWDYNNRLKQSVVGGVTSTYGYDHEGQRVRLSSGSTTTYYPTKYFNTDGTSPTKHIFANGMEIGVVNGRGAAATARYTATDHLTGSSIVTNASGNIEETLDYYPFGNIRIDSGTYSDQRKFIGQEHDSDTGLDYFNARYYDASIGRFLSQDPEFWGLSLDYLIDPQQQNSYSYARNNPLSYIDSKGEKAELMVRPITFFSQSIPFLGKVDFTIPGAHGGIIVTAEPGENLNQYGSGPRYSIGGYKDNGVLRVRLNDSRDLDYPASKYLTSIPLSPPNGTSVAEYDRKLLESGSNLAKGSNGSDNLGTYNFTGQPIRSKPNSGNAVAQIIINAGGTVPPIKHVYSGYLPLGLDSNPVGTPSYTQRAVTGIKNSVSSVKSKVTSTISKAFNFLK